MVEKFTSLHNDILRTLIHYMDHCNLYNTERDKLAIKMDKFIPSDDTINRLANFCNSYYFKVQEDKEFSNAVISVLSCINYFGENDYEIKKYLEDPLLYNFEKIDLDKYNKDCYITRADIVRLSLLIDWNKCCGNIDRFKSILVSNNI